MTLLNSTILYSKIYSVNSTVENISQFAHPPYYGVDLTSKQSNCTNFD